MGLFHVKYDAMCAQFNDDDVGKSVVNSNGDEVGIVSDVEHGTAHVKPDAGITDTIKAKLGWQGTDEDTFPLQETAVASVSDDEIRLEGDLGDAGDTATGATAGAGSAAGTDRGDESMRDDDGILDDDDGLMDDDGSRSDDDSLMGDDESGSDDSNLMDDDDDGLLDSDDERRADESGTRTGDDDDETI